MVDLHVDTALPWSQRGVETLRQRHPELSPRWHYEPGVALLSVQKTWEWAGSPPDHPWFAYIRRNMDAFIQPDGAIRTYDMADYNLDQVNQGRLLFDLYGITGEARYKTAASTLRQQLRTQPRNAQGGFWHKQRYPEQMWLDGLYMASPFYAQYGLAFDEPEAFDDIALQVALFDRHAREAQTGLLFHAWDAARSQGWAHPQTGCSPNFWARAVGWFMMALPDLLDYFPAGHPAWPDIVAAYRRTASAVLRCQDQATGTWYQILDQPDRPGNYLEASASCMFVYSLVKGVRLGYLDHGILEAARRGYAGILAQFVRVDDSGWVNLDRICSVGGLGGTPYRDGSFQYYISESVVSNDYKGFGAFIMASGEIENAGETVS